MKNLLIMIVLLSAFCLTNVSYSKGTNNQDELLSGTLRITRPNGGEKIIAGSDFMVRWKGCQATDTVTLEYSADRGMSWILITDKATGLSYLWKDVPETFSDECQIRARLLIKSEIKNEQRVLGLGTLECIAVHPKDPNIIASAGGRGLIFVWDLKKGKIIDTIGNGTFSINSIAFSPDGQRIASGSWTNSLRIWDIKTHACLDTFFGNTGILKFVSFSPDGRKIVGGSDDQSLRIWDTKSGVCLINVYGRFQGMSSLAFSPDSKRLVCIGNRGEIFIRDADSGQCLDTLTGDYWGVSSVAFSPDGNYIASAGQDRKIRLWDAGSGGCLDTIIEPQYINSIAFSPDGQYIVSGNYDNKIRIWNRQTGECFDTLTGHNDGVTIVNYTMDGKKIISGCNDQAVCLWDSETGDCLDTLTGHSSQIMSISFNDNGQRIASGGFDKSVKVWDTNTGECLKVMNGHKEAIYSVAYSPDGKGIVSGALREFRVWDNATGECKYTKKQSGQIIEFNPSGLDFASSCINPAGDILIWDAETTDCLDTLKGHSDYLTSFSYSHDGKRMVSCSMDRTIRIWDMNTNECLVILPCTAYSTAFSPDGEKLATTKGGLILIWEVNTGNCVDTLMAFNDGITNLMKLSFSPDGKQLAVIGDYDNTTRIIDIQSGFCLDTLTGPIDQQSSIKHSQDGKNIAVGSYDGTIRIWDAGNLNYFQDDASDSLFSIVDPSSAGDDITNDYKLVCSPNPAGNSVNIRFDSDKFGPGLVYITDISGRIVKQIDCVSESGNRTINADIRDLIPGSYFIVLETPDGCQARKIEVVI